MNWVKHILSAIFKNVSSKSRKETTSSLNSGILAKIFQAHLLMNRLSIYMNANIIESTFMLWRGFVFF